ncbi:MAG: hypothetical protein SNJ71_00815 [Bacteroidales bacterium]
MSIIYKGARNGGLQKDKDGQISTTRVFVFYFNEAESAATVLRDANIPELGTAHPDNSTLLATSISISEPMEGDTIKSGKYEVTVTYTRPQNNISIQSTVPPWDRDPFNISFSPLEIVVPFQKGYDQQKDVNGSPSVPVLNSAGDPFEDSTTQMNLIIKFSYNLKFFDPIWIIKYMDTINKSDVQILGVEIPARKGRIKNLAASKMQTYKENGSLEYEYYQVDIEIEVAKSEWKKEIMQRGLFALQTPNTISSKYRIYIDTDGTLGNKADLSDEAIPVDEPQKLNQDGTVLSSQNTAKYATFYDKYECSWKELNIPEMVIKDNSIFKFSNATAGL